MAAQTSLCRILLKTRKTGFLASRLVYKSTVYMCMLTESGVGAGIDSYYEYVLKAYILLGDDTYLERFNKVIF